MRRCAWKRTRLFIRSGGSVSVTGSGEKIPTAELDVRTLPPEERVAAWTQFVRAMYEATPVGPRERPLQSRTKSWIVGDLIFGHTTFDSQSMQRRKGIEIIEGARQFLLVVRFLSGSSHVMHDGDIYDSLPGRYLVADYSREIRSLMSDGQLIAVAVPHDVVGYSPETCPPRYWFELDSAAGKLLDSAYHTVMDALPNMTLEEAPQASAFFSGALAGLLKPAGKPADAEADKRRDIRAFIDDSMFDPDLSAESLAAQFGISRATLYRQFEDEGGLMAYVYGRRLDYALRVLSFGASRRGRISEVAKKIGYASVSHFSRAFSQKFGLSPSSIMGKFPGAGSGEIAGDYENVVWETWYGGHGSYKAVGAAE